MKTSPTKTHHKAPESTENLTRDAAVKKIRDLAESARTCLFGTISNSPLLSVRPMAVQTVDDAGSIWFLSGRSSDKNEHILDDPRVQLFFANTGASEYLTLDGTAVIHEDRATREKHWSAIAKTWFPGGVDDPDLTVIEVQITDGHYWDTKHGKMVSLMKIAVGAITGKQMDDGVEGNVRP
jgi:general stress protein 26